MERRLDSINRSSLPDMRPQKSFPVTYMSLEIKAIEQKNPKDIMVVCYRIWYRNQLQLSVIAAVTVAAILMLATMSSPTRQLEVECVALQDNPAHANLFGPPST